MNNSPEQNPVVHTYTRAEALADGVLLDLAPLARQMGFVIPVAMTATVWASYGPAGQTPAADLGVPWDILWMLRGVAAGSLPAHRKRGANGETLRFKLKLTPRGKSAAELVSLKIICGPGDDTAPVITILLPGKIETPLTRLMRGG